MARALGETLGEAPGEGVLVGAETGIDNPEIFDNDLVKVRRYD